MRNKIIVEFVDHRSGRKTDLRLELSMTAMELFIGLNSSFQLGRDPQIISDCYLAAENPIVLLKGNKTLQEFGLRNGSIIHFVRNKED